jgi:mono/diheme cytochrome c family protein
LKKIGFETFTADGPISYWNSYEGVSQMGGQGTFRDSRIGLDIVQEPDLVTPKLRALLAYQLSLTAPKAPAGSFDAMAAARGKQLFRHEARCATCHSGPALPDLLSG